MDWLFNVKLVDFFWKQIQVLPTSAKTTVFIKIVFQPKNDENSQNTGNLDLATFMSTIGEDKSETAKTKEICTWPTLVR